MTITHVKDYDYYPVLGLKRVNMTKDKDFSRRGQKYMGRAKPDDEIDNAILKVLLNHGVMKEEELYIEVVKLLELLGRFEKKVDRDNNDTVSESSRSNHKNNLR